MKTKLASAIFLASFFALALKVQAETQTRKVDQFTEISLRVGATVHLEQGEPQSLEITAKSSTLEELITEVKDGKLIIRFPNKDFFWKTFQPGEITINITVPRITGLGVSGSGDIVAADGIKTKDLELAVSGSGNIKIDDLAAVAVKSIISGSGNIVLSGNKTAEDLSVVISGSGNFKGMNFSADDVNVRVSGSGNVDLQANKNLNIRMFGSGDVTYKGHPLVDQSVAGSGKVKHLN
jgi:hypothetical protein